MAASIRARILARIGRTEPAAQRKGQRRKLDRLLKVTGDRVAGISQLLQRRDAPLELRHTAAWVLGVLRDRRTVPVLCRLLADETDQAWWSVAGSVQLMRDARAGPILLRLMRQASSARMRGWSANLLGWLPAAPGTVPALIEVYKDEQEDANVRGNAAEALGLLADQAAFEPLLAGLNDASPEVRFWSAYGLACLRNPQALPALEAAADQDTGVVPGWWSVADECRQAIYSIRVAAGEDLPPIDDPTPVPRS